MITTKKSRVSSASTGAGQGNKSAQSTGLSSHQHPEAHPSQPSESKIVRLKFTKPRPPRVKPKEVDWDEDLRPTPNEIVEAKEKDGRTTHAHTDPSKPKRDGKKTGNKRTKASKPQTTSAKRRKPNPRKPTNSKRKVEEPQLPLVTIAASALAATNDRERSAIPDQLGIPENAAAKTQLGSPFVPRQAFPTRDSQHAAVKAPSCTSVTSDSSSDFDYGIKLPSHSQIVNILEFKAQAREPKTNDKAAHMDSDASSSSGGHLKQKQSARGDTLQLTIQESRALPKISTKGRGRAQSVGNKLLLALHGKDDSQTVAKDQKQKPVTNERAPIVISSDPVEPPQVEPLGSMPVGTALPAPAPVAYESGRIDHRLHQVISGVVKSPSPTDIDDTKEVEAIDAIGRMASWGSFLESLSGRSSSEDSDMEVGRGLMGYDPSILDDNIEMEHLSGFAALQPMQSEVTTSSQLTKECRSQVPTSGTSTTGKVIGNTIDPTAICIEKRESSHTPEDLEPLLPNGAAVISPPPQQPNSVPRTTIVDRNGSPRLMPQMDMDEDRLTDTSLSQYDRASSDHSTESQYEGVIWSKFQREMFLAYGIETEKMPRSYPWLPHPKPFSQEGTADGAGPDESSTNESSSSQRTIDERALGAPHDHHSDRSFRTEISGSTQPQTKSHRFSDEDPMEWISALQVAQKDASNLLYQTNTNLSTQLAAEKATISRVLEIYQQGCGRILDDLFQAQQTRMKLYRQQMQQVKDQHADICQDLVRGLRELDRRVQHGP